MSVMSNMHIDIMDMLSAGCSRGFIAGELSMHYEIEYDEACRFVDCVSSELDELVMENDYND